MEGVWYDGRVAAPRRAALAVEAGALVIAADGEERCWPLQQVRAEAAGDRVRLTGPPGDEGRLMLDAADWRRLAPEHAERGRAGARSRELKLVTGLAAVGIAGALFVFVGMPAAAGPLASVTPLAWEERIGRNFESQIGTVFKPCRDGPGAAALARLGETLEAHSPTKLDVRVRAVEAPMVNAFALPGGAVFVTDDLIEAARNPDELAGVVAHEVAHIQERHVMRAVWRSIGAGMLLDLLVGGGGGAGQQAVLLAGSFTELSYSREVEAEADAQGRALLHAAGLTSRGMASFFQHLANEESGEAARTLTEFMGSHPDSARRAARARADERPGRSALTAEEWRALRALCTASDNPVDRFRIRRGEGRRPPGGDEVREVRQD